MATLCQGEAADGRITCSPAAAGCKLVFSWGVWSKDKGMSCGLSRLMPGGICAVLCVSQKENNLHDFVLDFSLFSRLYLLPSAQSGLSSYYASPPRLCCFCFLFFFCFFAHSIFQSIPCFALLHHHYVAATTTTINKNKAKQANTDLPSVFWFQTSPSSHHTVPILSWSVL